MSVRPHGPHKALIKIVLLSVQRPFACAQGFVRHGLEHGLSHSPRCGAMNRATRTLLFRPTYLLRTDPEFSGVFRGLLKNTGRRMALAIFEVPRRIPYPIFSVTPAKS